MKNLKIISFTREGSNLNAKMLEQFNNCGYQCQGYTVTQFADEFGLEVISSELKSWVGQQWGRTDFLFIGAVGIAVRTIAPWIEDKYTDSAVVVIDEMAKHVIPVLSTHMGGAGDIANMIAWLTDAEPVFTTATDVQDKFAVDLFAKKNRLQITNRKLVKSISASVLEENVVGFYSCYPVGEEIPPELAVCRNMGELKKYDYGIAVVDRIPRQEETNILYLIPEGVIVGIGCRRGTPKLTLKLALSKLLQIHNISADEVTSLVSIDLKKDEKGLLELADELEVPVTFYSCGQLKTVSRVSCQSIFVEQATGVDNVCERAASYHYPEGELIQEKTVIDGVTLALVRNTISRL